MIQKEWFGSSENTRKKEMEQSGNRDSEGKKKEPSGRKDPQKGINRACTYLRKEESKLESSISQQKVST